MAFRGASPYASTMSTPTPAIAMRQLAINRLEELAKAVDLAGHRHAAFECGLISSLRLHGVELPLLPSGTLNLHELHIRVDDMSSRRLWDGVRFHTISRPSTASLPREFQRDYPPTSIADGITATHPLMAWAQMARFLDRIELTVLADSMMRRNQSSPHFTPDDFRALMDVLPASFRGRQHCIWALSLMRENTDSSMETRLRLRLCQEALHELHSLVVNHKVIVDDEGAFMFLDMALPELHIGIEYAGRHHAEQWSDDVTRQSALTAAGWEILTAHNDTMKDPAQWREFMVRLTSLMLQQRHRLSG